MSEDPLVIARRLAIRLLHEAQLSPANPVRGLIGAQAGEPTSVYPWTGTAARGELEAQINARGEQLWAVYRSNPQAPALPEDTDRALVDGVYLLIISLDTKGVLEMRCWDWRSGTAQERILKIKD
jgi:hypothetical protein